VRHEVTGDGQEVDVTTEQRLVAGRYRLLSAIGTGGMGTVWRAQDALLDREVAVKEVVFPRGLSEQERENLRERTRREARSAAKLQHPSAVTVYDVVEQDGQPFLVMELVEARTLAEVVRDDGPLPADRAAQIGLAVLGALEAAHAQGIVHRDVKPGNVLLCPDEHSSGRVVLTDFGIATSAGDPSITSTGLLLGSPSYISPERAQGQSPGPASDLWSLGATLFTAVEVRPPYDTGEPITTMTAVVTGEHAPYVAAGPLVPVLEGLLEKDPGARSDAAAARRGLTAVLADPHAAPPQAQPQPAAELRSERTSALELGDLQFAASETQSGHPRRGAGRGRKVFAVLLAVVVLAGVGAGGFLLETRGPSARGGTVPSAPASAGTTPSPSAAAVPSDWQTYRSPDGWSVRYPPDWTQGTFGNQIQFRDGARRRVLRVDTSALGSNVLQSVQGTRDQFRGRYSASYQELSLAEAQFQGHPGALWEFTYSDQGVDLHALDQAFTTGSASYALYFQTRAADFESSRGIAQQLFSTFQPRP